MEMIKLNNATEIPSAGLGTFLLEPDDAQKAVVSAIHDGYTLIDTANAYMNEKAVGRGIRESGKKREEIYLSTKLWPSIYSSAEDAIDETLKRLDTDYIDLLFLHQPIGDCIHAYKAMEEAVKAGKVRSLGLSNFSIDQVRETVAETDILPSVIQVEAHPYYPQSELKEYLETIGARIMSWYPLGHGDASLMNEPVFKELADRYHKTAAQVILRWHIQNELIVIPGSKNPAHIKDNIDLFDFKLTEEEMNRIASLDKKTRYYNQTQAMLEGYLNFRPVFNSQK